MLLSRRAGTSAFRVWVRALVNGEFFSFESAKLLYPANWIHLDDSTMKMFPGKIYYGWWILACAVLIHFMSTRHAAKCLGKVTPLPLLSIARLD